MLLLTFIFSGCHKTIGTFDQRDSTKIKIIEEMQSRGNSLRNTSDFEEAIAVHDSCIQMSQEIGDTIQWVIALNHQGTNFRRLGALNEASDLHYQALDLCDEYSDKQSFTAKKNRVRSLNGLGNIFLSIGNSEAAEKHLRQALQGETDLGSGTGQAINLANLGSIKESQGQLDSARVYYNRSMEKNREAENTVGICLCYTHLGELDEHLGKINSATDNFRKAFTVGQSTGDVWHWLTPCISLAENFLVLNQTDSAAKYISIGMQAAEQIHSNEHLASLYGLRSKLEEKCGQTAFSLKDLQKSLVFRDSLVNEENRNSIQNKRVNYTIKHTADAVKAAEDEARLNRLIRNSTIILCFIIVVSLLIWYFLVRRAYKIRKKAENEREEFYRNVTHQLRTPLTVVLGMMDQLNNHIPEKDSEGRKELEAAQRQGRHLLTLVKELIAGSRAGFKTDLANAASQTAPATPAPKDKEGNSIISKIATTNTHTGSTILLAEDNEDVAIMMCSLLRENGYVVSHAIDGKDALDMLNDELPDLLITDIAMPRMDGLELMRKVREDESMNHLPIIVVSARVEDHERLEGISAGAEVYLAKPFINEELLLRVKKILDQRDLLRQRFGVNAPVSTAKVELPAKESEFLATLNEVIEQNMMDGDFNSTTLAEKMCMSVSTLNRRMNNLTGLPTMVYMRNRRLLAVKKMLTTTDKSINEIELACGFNTPGHMGRLFRTEVGCSPSEYRRQHQ